MLAVGPYSGPRAVCGAVAQLAKSATQVIAAVARMWISTLGVFAIMFERDFSIYAKRPAVQDILIKLDLSPRPMTIGAATQMNMKKNIYLLTAAVSLGMLLSMAATSYAQKTGRMGKAEAIAQQLNLTPDQKAKVLPILRAEAPKVEAIKNDNSLSKIQKLQQLRAIHQQTDPEMKAILTPAQYEKLKAIRQQTIRDATQALH